MTARPMPEIREADAPADVAAIYREIRSATGLPLVNLGWRHFAALPEVLPWVWDVLGPHYRSGAVAGAAARLREASDDLALAPIGVKELAAIGLDEGDRTAFANLLAVYNRGNLFNLVGFSSLLHRLHEPSVTPASDEMVELGNPPALPPLPPLPRLAALEPALAAVVSRLAEHHREFPTGAVPSLYLHFACWPGLPALVDQRLAPVATDGRLAAAARSLETVARGKASRLSGDLRPSPPPARVAEIVAPALARFASGAIQQMIVVGTALNAALKRD